MKRHKNLWDRVISLDNLYEAARKAQKGKRFQENIALFNLNLEKEIFRIQREFIDKSYLPGPYKEFHIIEPKLRLISAAPYRDRVVHHALCNVIEPIFDRMFIYDSYACRKGKGTHRAIDRFQKFAHKTRYVLKCDIVKYFPSIDHEILYELIERKIACKDTLWLIKLIIDHSNEQEPVLHYFKGDHLLTPIQRRIGIPIGNLTSQFFANIYLNGMGHFLREKLGCKFYIRYVDDFVILHDDKEFLWRVKQEIEEYLENLRLKLHPRKCRVFPVKEGTLFLGFRIWPDKRRLDRQNIRRFQSRIKLMQSQYAKGELAFDKLTASIQSWVAHASYGETWHLREHLFRDIVFRKGLTDKRSPCSPGRFLEQQSEQLAIIKPQQEQSRQQEQQQRFSLCEHSSTSQAGIDMFTDILSAP